MFKKSISTLIIMMTASLLFTFHSFADGIVHVRSSTLPTGAATAANQTTTNGYIDQVEGYLDQVEGYLDGLEGYVDGVEGLIGTTNTNTGNSATSLGILDDWDNGASDGASVSGDVAHGTSDAGEPVKIGFKVETSPKGITVEADGDRTDGYSDADGIQIVKLNTTGADLVSEQVSNTNGTSTAFTNFSAVASTYNYVNCITVYNASATAGYVDFRDGTAGTVKWTMPAPAGGGSVACTATPLFKTSANTAVAYDVSGALTTVYISLSGWQSKI